MRSHIVIRATNTTDKKVKAALLDPFDIIENKQKIPGVDIEICDYSPSTLKMLLLNQVVKVKGIKYRQTLLRPLKLSENPPRTAKRTKSLFAESLTSYGVRGVLSMTMKRDDMITLPVAEEEYWAMRMFFLGAQTRNEHIFSAIWGYVPAHTLIKYTIAIEVPDPIYHPQYDPSKGKTMSNKAVFERNSAKLKEREELLKWQIPGYFIQSMQSIYDMSENAIAHFMGIHPLRMKFLIYNTPLQAPQSQWEKQQILKAMNINSFIQMVEGYSGKAMTRIEVKGHLSHLNKVKSDAKKLEALRNEFNIN